VAYRLDYQITVTYIIVMTTGKKTSDAKKNLIWQ